MKVNYTSFWMASNIDSIDKWFNPLTFKRKYKIYLLMAKPHAKHFDLVFKGPAKWMVDSDTINTVLINYPEHFDYLYAKKTLRWAIDHRVLVSHFPDKAEQWFDPIQVIKGHADIKQCIRSKFKQYRKLEANSDYCHIYLPSNFNWQTQINSHLLYGED